MNIIVPNDKFWKGGGGANKAVFAQTFVAIDGM